jgi:hypothetical protein
MAKFTEFRNYETKLGDGMEFLEMINKSYTLNGAEKTLKILKSTGLLVNQYPGHHKYEKLVKDLEELILSWQDPNSMKIWREIKSQAEVFNSLFQECYSSDDYVSLEGLPRDVEVEVFLAGIEIALSSLKSEKTFLSRDINFMHAFSKHDSVAMEKSKMFNYLSGMAGPILSYLLYYKKPKVQIQPHLALNEVDIIKSMGHFTSYDKVQVLRDVVDYWRYNDYDVKTKNKTIYLKPKNKISYLSDEISISRFETRREKLNLEIAQHHQDDNFYSFNDLTSLPPEHFINKDELVTFHSIQEYFFLSDMKHLVLGVPLNEWIRAYSVLKLICNKHLENRSLDGPITVQGLCLVITEEEIRKQFINHCINVENVSTIISKLNFTLGETDLFDTPLIKTGGSQFIIVPSIVALMDITRVLMCNFLKNEANLEFKGLGFEEKIINDLREQNINSGSLKAEGSINEGPERTFQCDLAFIIDKDLFFCEIKSFSQPTTHRGFYELLGKKEEATVQLRSISEFYGKNMDIVRTQLGIFESWTPKKIYNLLIVTTPVGVGEKINRTFIIDYSGFVTFIKRMKPGITVLSKGVHFEFNVFPEFNEEITTEKLIKFLKKPMQVEYEKVRRKSIVKQINYGGFDVRMFDYITKFDDKISQEDENAKKYLLKVGRNIFNMKRKKKR